VRLSPNSATVAVFCSATVASACGQGFRFSVTHNATRFEDLKYLCLCFNFKPTLLCDYNNCTMDQELWTGLLQRTVVEGCSRPYSGRPAAANPPPQNFKFITQYDRLSQQQLGLLVFNTEEHQMAAFSCVKWRHGRHLESMTSYQTNSTPSIDAHLGVILPNFIPIRFESVYFRNSSALPCSLAVCPMEISDLRFAGLCHW